MHPDKNMGSALASESFKKIQCAYEVTFFSFIVGSVKKILFFYLMSTTDEFSFTIFRFFLIR